MFSRTSMAETLQRREEFEPVRQQMQQQFYQATAQAWGEGGTMRNAINTTVRDVQWRDPSEVACENLMRCTTGAFVEMLDTYDMEASDYSGCSWLATKVGIKLGSLVALVVGVIELVIRTPLAIIGYLGSFVGFPSASEEEDSAYQTLVSGPQRTLSAMQGAASLLNPLN